MIRLRKFLPTLLVLVLCFMAGSLYAQSDPPLRQRVSGTWNNVPVSEILHSISTKYNLKFSYDPEKIPVARHVSISVANKPLYQVLQLILVDKTLAYKELDNQIVIYRTDAVPVKTEITKVVSPDKVISPPSKKVHDTLYILRSDTIQLVRYDTVVRVQVKVDTIKLIDTIRLMPPGILPDTAQRAWSFGMGLAWTPMNISFSNEEVQGYAQKLSGTMSHSWGNYHLGCFLQHSANKVSWGAGLGYSHLSESFSYLKLSSQGGFYQQYVADTFYTVSGPDTNYFYVYDSTWIPGNTTLSNMHFVNTYHYLNLPVFVKWKPWGKGSPFYLTASTSMLICISGSAYIVDPVSDDAIQIKSANLNTWLLNWDAGLGIEKKWAGGIKAFGELSYGRSARNQYKQLPVEREYGFFRLKAGFLLPLGWK